MINENRLKTSKGFDVVFDLVIFLFLLFKHKSSQVHPAGRADREEAPLLFRALLLLKKIALEGPGCPTSLATPKPFRPLGFRL